MTDTADSTQRGRERNKLIRLALVVGGLDRVVTLLNALLRVGLLAYLLSNLDYGLYVAVLGIVATANLLDFGLHFGLVSAVARAAGDDDDTRIQSIMSTGGAVYSAIACAALVVVVPGFAFGPVEWLFGLRPEQVAPARVIAIIGFGGLLISLPMKVTTAGLLGTQLSYVVSAFRSTSGIVGTLALATTALVFRGRLLPIAIVSAVTDVAGGLLLTAWSLRAYGERFRLSIRAIDRRIVPNLVGTGMTFFIANLANLFKRSFVTVAISHSLGTAFVPRLSVPLALFTTGLAFTDIAGASLWPAYGEAVARRDWGWVERAFRVSTRGSLIVAFALATLGIVSGDEVLHIWTVKIPPPSRALLVWLAIWLVSQTLVSTSSSLLNGIGRSRLVMVVALVEGIVTFTAAATLVRFFDIAGSGAAMALSGVAVALYLMGTALPRATEGHVHGQLPMVLRIVPCTLIAAVVGATAESFLKVVPLRLVVGATSAAAVYGALVWLVILSAGERAAAVAFVASRTTRRKTAEK